ncbi:MAG TPA: hypothetical protein VGD10_02655 [Allosphingosinicella sp.]|uniref:hypothetical protein n=1 Tax=Allosphingosinicella sp. TaxID=2823234 RepID=UPI002ED86151
MRILKAVVLAGLMIGSPAAAQVSEASQKIIREHFEQRKAEMGPLIARKRELEAARDALLTPATYDEEKLAATIAGLKEVEGQIFDKVNGSTLTLLKSLPEEDRSAFMKTLSKAPPKAAAGPSK